MANTAPYQYHPNCLRRLVPYISAWPEGTSQAIYDPQDHVILAAFKLKRREDAETINAQITELHKQVASFALADAPRPTMAKSMKDELMNRYNAENPPTRDDVLRGVSEALAPRDYLAEAGRILRGETLMIPTYQHLNAVVKLLSIAYRELYCANDDLLEPSIQDWLRDVRQVL